MRNRKKQREVKKRPIILGPWMDSPKSRATSGRVFPEQGRSSVKFSDSTYWKAERRTRKHYKEVRKMKREQSIASVALDPEAKNKLEQLAKLKGTSLSKMIKMDLVFSLGFSDDFKLAIYRLAEDLGVTPSHVIEHLALAYWARMAGKEEVAGHPISKELAVFVPGLSAQQFFQERKDEEVKEIQSINRLKQDMASFYTGKTKPQIMELKYQKEGEGHDAEIAQLPAEQQSKIKRAEAHLQELRKKDKTSHWE